MPDEDICFATVRELNAKLKAREISALELTRLFSDRLEKFGPRYNALALPLREQAIRDAMAIDKDLKREWFSSPVQGVPYGAKDLLSVAGQPTAWGARPYAGQVFDYTAAVIEKLHKQGAILLGKLAMVELAGGGGYRSASASSTGPGLNPWNRARWSGGSSSGPGAAVAAGLAPFALGSETQGSILTPSAFCGVTGLRPTYGLVSRYGAMALSWTMDKIGPMCRSADDCGLVLHEIAGKDWRDPGSAGRSFYYTPQWARPLSKLRVGFAPADLEEWALPAARPVFQTAFDLIRKLGGQMTETALADLPYGLASGAVIAVEGAAVFEPDIRSGKLEDLQDKSQIAGLKAGLDILAKDYLKAQRIRTLVQESLRKQLNTVDVLLSPTRFGPANSATEPFDRSGSDAAAPKKPGLSSLIAAGNLAGLPALSLPCGFVDGLPLAIQLVGPPFSENTLIAIGCEFQKATDWHKRRPPVGA